jgi:hypothetical protein
MLHLNTGKRYRYGNIKLQQDILDPDYKNQEITALWHRYIAVH